MVTGLEIERAVVLEGKSLVPATASILPDHLHHRTVDAAAHAHQCNLVALFDAPGSDRLRQCNRQRGGTDVPNSSNVVKTFDMSRFNRAQSFLVFDLLTWCRI